VLIVGTPTASKEHFTMRISLILVALVIAAQIPTMLLTGQPSIPMQMVSSLYQIVVHGLPCTTDLDCKCIEDCLTIVSK
jgi:hypothetical protein